MKVRDAVDISKYSYVITINNDRYEYQKRVFAHYGIPQPIKFDGLKKEPTPEDGCLYSHISLIMMARCLDFPYIVIFEDDAYPRKDIKEKLEYYLQRIPYNCGLLSMGKNGHRGLVEKFDDFHIIKERPYGSHAYIVFKEAYDEYINSLEKQRVSDIAMRGNNFYKCKSYWTNENLFIQKNIDVSAVSQTSKRYFSPHPKTSDLMLTNIVPDGFEDKIPGILEKEIHFVNHYSWRGNCALNWENNIIKHCNDIGNLKSVSDNVWKIEWENYPRSNEFLIKDTEGKFRIEKNYKLSK